MMLVGIALTLSTCAGVRGREAAVVDAEAERERERQRWSVVTHGVCACVQMVAQAKASSSAMDDRILRLLAELGRRGIEACEIDEFFEYLDRFEATQASAAATSETNAAE